MRLAVPALTIRPVAVVLAALVATGLLLAPAAAPPARAATGLTIVGDARYDVQPDQHRVRVTVDLVVTNHLGDTASRRYYYDRAYLDVLPGTAAFRISSPTGKPTVRLYQKRSQYNRLLLMFGQQVRSGRSAALRLVFDLPDPGGVAARDVRVGAALVAFPVWAYGYPNGVAGGSVSVAFPAGYTVQVEAGTLPGPTTDAAGRSVYATGRLADPVAFFAYVVADRPGQFAEERLSTRVGEAAAELTIRSWPDDPGWAARVGGLFERGLPALHELVGLPWPRPGPLVVQETVSRTTGGYAGLFDPSEGRVEVAYYADTFVVLHEASHAWFNGTLLADRWANEAFASWYALAAAKALGETAAGEDLTPALRASRIPLNDWSPLGTEAGVVEDYAYAASVRLAAAIAERAGVDGLRDVWAAASAREAAYQPSTADASGGGAAASLEGMAAAPDWRGLLDLLEDHTGAEYDDLWRDWVVRDAERPLLEARRTARADYESTVAAAGDWKLPRSVRDALRSWRFADARTQLADARRLLGRRDSLEEAAADAGLVLPGRLEAAFEGEGGFVAATAEADAEAAAIQALVAAAAARPAAVGPLAQLGLVGESPEAGLAAARADFSSGNLLEATRAAAAVRTAWLTAEDLGRNRILAALGIALLAGLAILLSISGWRERQTSGRPARDMIEPPDAGPIAG